MITTSLTRTMPSRQLLAGILETPNLVTAMRAMPTDSFAALVKHVGVEDLGEVIALASTEQIVAAFDEDLFTNERAGDRETLDPARFAAWLEVLLEAGDQAAADRIAELSLDFTAHALHQLVIVLDQDALRDRLREGDDDAERADKAIESALSEEIDGYLLISRGQVGWDAVLALVLALDRDHREQLVRVLDLCVEASHGYLDDLDALVTALDAAEALAEQVEGERYERRAAQGHVESRSARHFLELARRSTGEDPAALERDPITRAYFRELDRHANERRHHTGVSNAALLQWSASDAIDLDRAAPHADTDDATTRVIEALRTLQTEAPETFDARMEELVYLANVLVAGGERSGERYRSVEAAHVALGTVAAGIALEAARRASDGAQADWVAILLDCSADRLFRHAVASTGATA